MLATDLLSRSQGSVSSFAFEQQQSTRLLHALQPAPHVLFKSGSPSSSATAAGNGSAASHGLEAQAVAHRAGVNALAIERFEGRYLVSGGADGGISMWDLEAAEGNGGDGRGTIVHTPLGSVKRTSTSHTYGTTGLSFYPFDSLAFLSSSYDHTLKVHDSTTLDTSASFSLDSVIYSHSISPIAQHLLVACATQHPSVRLIDLRSGAATQALAGHGGGAVLAVAWSPRDGHILASGGTDGAVRLWDIRRSAGSLGVLDMEDSVGIAGHDGLGTIARRRERGKAHVGPVNGVVWTENATNIVTAGHDERIRVWDAATGANTLANFGPIVRNASLSTLLPALAPKRLVGPGDDILFFPSEKEILMYEMLEGRLLKRLRAPGLILTPSQNERSGQRNLKNRVVALACRPHSVELLSGHADGAIRSWRPRTAVDAFVDDAPDFAEDEESNEAASRKRKRETLEEIHRDLTTAKVTFI